jgi:predicted GNAT family acetyltransferase
MQTPEIIKNEKEQQFEIHLEGEKAFMQYRLHDGKIALMHTEVPDKLGRRGLATALVEYALKYARDHKLPVLAYCPFVVTYLKRHPDQMDIVVNLPNP